MEERIFHPILDADANSGIERSLRDIPPAHYTLKIESFLALSKFLQEAGVQKHESDVFEASGFKWNLSIYPNGKKGYGEGHISLYLRIVETDKLPLGWEVNVNFKLFIYDQIQDKYMAIQDTNGKVRRFHNMKSEWGFDRLLPLSSFTDATNGYLVDDKCVFGVEVFVINYCGRGESLALLEEGLTNTHTWKIEKFSFRNKTFLASEVFTIAKRNWKLNLFPTGDSREEGKSLSLYIHLVDLNSFPTDRKTYAKYLLRVRDQRHGKHAEVQGTHCFTTSTSAWGRASTLCLKRLHDASEGFLVNDTLVIEAQIQCITTVNNFSKKAPVHCFA